MSHGVNVLALVKGDQRYIFLFDNQSREQMLQTLERFAADPELSLTWYDAAVLSQKVRQSAAESTPTSPAPVEEVTSPGVGMDPAEIGESAQSDREFPQPTGEGAVADNLSAPSTEASITDARGVWQPTDPRFPRPRIPR